MKTCLCGGEKSRKEKSTMPPTAHQVWWRIAGLSGASWVGMAAYGAHGLKGVDSSLQKAFDNGNKMHGMHSIMLAVTPLLKRPHIAGALFSTGTAIFSGSCYAVALTKDREKYGGFAPYGGSLLILGWLSLVI